MSILTEQTKVSRIEKEIADLHKKVATETKKECDNQGRINSIERSITKNTPASLLASRQRQIDGYSRNILDSRKKNADFQQKIATKSQEVGRAKESLRKAEERERQKAHREETEFRRKLQLDIKKQTDILDTLIHQNYSAPIQQDRNESIEYDFFISHASEDKQDFVKDFADSLVAAGFKVWYDAFELKIGDSLRKKIDQGLSNSRYGIVIISPNFIRKNWTEYELNGMVAREMNGHKVILPIWHKVTKDEVLKYSPTLADKLALNTAIHSINDIIDNLKAL